MILTKSTLLSNKTITVSGSKSISNRLLILHALFSNIRITNLSDSQDTKLLQAALENNSDTIDVHHAGTAMRFLTSYFAIREGKTTILTGSDRMKQRPIKPLVDALKQLGAEIDYLENDGYPPLKITGHKLSGGEVKIQANVSSQFITSLMLIGAKLENGITIILEGKITSIPYLEMTLKILRTIGISNSWESDTIKVEPNIQTEKNSQIIPFTLERDGSSASYFYSLAAIGRNSISLKCFKPFSLQGDSAIRELYWEYFGVNTISEGAEAKISLLPESNCKYPERIELNMNACPDLAQTICVTAAALKISFHITGLETLKIKETDRLSALQNELFKIGCLTETTDESIWSTNFIESAANISIETYTDHRMAMSFAPFCLLQELSIENEEVVQKSYPNFWADLAQCLTPQTDLDEKQ